VTTTLRIDDVLKRDCEVVLEDLGLGMSGAVTLFLKQVVRIAQRYAAEMRKNCEREWIMEEIDAEIAHVHKERRERQANECETAGVK